jgi:hypothetical protein
MWIFLLFKFLSSLVRCGLMRIWSALRCILHQSQRTLINLKTVVCAALMPCRKRFRSLLFTSIFSTLIQFYLPPLSHIFMPNLPLCFLLCLISLLLSSLILSASFAFMLIYASICLSFVAAPPPLLTSLSHFASTFTLLCPWCESGNSTQINSSFNTIGPKCTN